MQIFPFSGDMGFFKASRLYWFRSVYCLYVSLTYLFFHMPTLFRNSILFSDPELGYQEKYIPSQLYSALTSSSFGFSNLKIFMTLVAVGFFLSAIGYRPRILFLLSLLGFSFVEILFSNSLAYYNTQIAFWTMFLLLCSTSAFSGKVKMAPKDELILFFVWLLVPSAYLHAACSKIISSGNIWWSGEALQSYFLLSHITTENKVAAFFVGYPTVCAILSRAVLIFELTWVLAVWKRSYLIFYLLGSFVFHGFIYLTFRIDLFHVFAGTFLVYLFWPRIEFSDFSFSVNQDSARN